MENNLTDKVSAIQTNPKILVQVKIFHLKNQRDRIKNLSNNRRKQQKLHSNLQREKSRRFLQNKENKIQKIKNLKLSNNNKHPFKTKLH